jgi:hypothetical protein
VQPELTGHDRSSNIGERHEVGDAVEDVLLHRAPETSSWRGFRFPRAFHRRTYSAQPGGEIRVGWDAPEIVQNGRHPTARVVPTDHDLAYPEVLDCVFDRRADTRITVSVGRNEIGHIADHEPTHPGPRRSGARG